MNVSDLPCTVQPGDEEKCVKFCWKCPDLYNAERQVQIAKGITTEGEFIEISKSTGEKGQMKPWLEHPHPIDFQRRW